MPHSAVLEPHGDERHTGPKQAAFNARLGHRQRDELADKLLRFTDSGGTFLEKLGSCLDHYHVKRPEVAVTYKVRKLHRGEVAC